MASGSGRASSPSASQAHCCRPSRPGRDAPSDAAVDRRHRCVAAARRVDRPSRTGPRTGGQGQRIRLRTRRAGRHRRRVRRHDRRRDGARARWSSGRCDAGGPHAEPAAARRHRTDPHHRLDRARRRARRVARSGPRQADVLGGARYGVTVDDLGPVPPRRAPPVSRSSASASTRRSPGPTTNMSTTSPRGSTSCNPTTRCG